MDSWTKQTRLVLLADDPTGSQTSHGCLLLTRWDPQTLALGLLDPAPLFFVLTNTRSMTEAAAVSVLAEVCRNLRLACEQHRIPLESLVVVSRSDSTLRGHFPAETQAISGELGTYDAVFLVPAFLEGGRITREGTHYVHSADDLVPVHQTDFARDSTFAYSSSFLPDWIAERSGGRIQAEQVTRIPTGLGQQQLRDLLVGLRGGVHCAVDAESADDLNAFAAAVRTCISAEKRFLFRSAASLIPALTELPVRPESTPLPGAPGSD